MNSFRGLFAILVTGFICHSAAADDYDSLRVQRNEVFEFTEKPGVVREGDRVTIRFTSKAYCDATIAIENATGRIIRHLASGVLGKNAPPPFRRNSLQQAVVWDGKDDQGAYVTPLDDVIVRVSLGLRPRFERTLLWSPHRRFGGMPLLASGPEGVYVCDGRGVDFIRLYNHDGDYVRSQYPFPSNMLKHVEGLTGMIFRKAIVFRVKAGYINSRC